MPPRRKELIPILAGYGFQPIGFDESEDSYDLRIGAYDAEQLVNMLTAYEEYQQALRSH